MISDRDVHALSLSDLVSLLHVVCTELQRRLVGPPDPPVFEPPSTSNTSTLRQPLCGYRCQFCDCPCTKGSDGHRHHKCYLHRHNRWNGVFRVTSIYRGFFGWFWTGIRWTCAAFFDSGFAGEIVAQFGAKHWPKNAPWERSLEYNFSQETVWFSWCTWNPLDAFGSSYTSACGSFRETYKNPKKVHVADHWRQVVANTDAASWKEVREAKMDVALERWFDIVAQTPEVHETVKQLYLVAGLSEQLRTLRDILSGKAPSTLTKRANAMLRYIEKLTEARIAVPGDEALLYNYFCELRDAGVPLSRLRALAESIGFTEFVLGIDGLCQRLFSKRCWGASRRTGETMTRQSGPFTVRRLACLHKVVHDDTELFWAHSLRSDDDPFIYSKGKVLSWTKLNSFLCVTWKFRRI